MLQNAGTAPYAEIATSSFPWLDFSDNSPTFGYFLTFPRQLPILRHHQDFVRSGHLGQCTMTHIYGAGRQLWPIAVMKLLTLRFSTNIDIADYKMTRSTGGLTRRNGSSEEQVWSGVLGPAGGFSDWSWLGGWRWLAWYRWSGLLLLLQVHSKLIIHLRSRLVRWQRTCKS